MVAAHESLVKGDLNPFAHEGLAQGRIFEREKMGEARQAIGGDVTLAPSSLVRQAAEQ